MRIRYHARALVAVALLAAGTALCGAEAKSPAAVRTAAGSSMQKLMEQASSQRERMIAEHEALAKQLREATEEQRKAILDKMQEQKKAFEAAQSALHKQIREEQRRQRQSAVPRR
jgi:K+/H+ antiporter YhaU regulatory subunit KhtT